MFYGCSSLKELNLNNFNTNNVTDMSFMFNFCESITSLPDISKWNTNKVVNMSSMFKGCESLKKAPPIYKWPTNNLIDDYGVFDGFNFTEN